MSSLPIALRVTLSGAALLAMATSSAAAPQIRVRNAGVPSPQVPQVTTRLEFLSAENETRSALVTQVAWSPDGKTGFEIEVPFVKLDADALGASDEASGLGDVRARVQRSLRQTDGVLTSTRWAIWGTVHLPTGDDEALRSGSTPFPRLLQPGMGAYGLGGGMAWTWIRDRHRLSTTLGAHWMSENNDFQMGTEITAALSYWYRLTPAVFDAEVTGHELELRPAIELIATHRLESDAFGSGIGDDGTLAWVAPGFQAFVAEDLLLQASVALPVSNGIDDPLGDRDWTALLAAKWYF